MELLIQSLTALLFITLMTFFSFGITLLVWVMIGKLIKTIWKTIRQ